MADLFSGTVSSVVYENDDFRIVKILLDDSTLKTPISAKGDFPGQNVKIGTWVSFEGKWDNHPTYGRQLTVTRSPSPVQRWSDEKALAALSGNGVGPSIRSQIQIAAHSKGLSIQELLDAGDLSDLACDPLIQAHAVSRWRSLRTYLDAASFMRDSGLPQKVVGKVWAKFGSDIEEALLRDPWVLVRVAGITFKEADKVAIKMGVSLDNPGRVQGAVLSSLKENVFEGHLYATTSQLVEKVRSKISNPTPSPRQIAEALAELKRLGSLVVEKNGDQKVVYDSWHHRAEVRCATLLTERANASTEGLAEAFAKVSQSVEALHKAGAGLTELSEAAVRNWSEATDIHLTQDQLEAATEALTAPVSILTGLPGTGKTTTLRAVVSVARDMGTNLLLVAPTGIAAKRMASVTGAEASTVHRAFGAKGFQKDDEERESTYIGIVGSSERKDDDSHKDEWEYGEDNPHPAELVVVDESSMLDLHMLHRILTSTRKDCRIMFVGDPFQLPSVGAGDILNSLCRSETFPHRHLDKVFRQEETSGIVLASHDVHVGKVPAPDGKDFLLLEAYDESHAADAIEKVAKKLYSLRKNFQVLSPRHAGDAGVTALNERLRLSLNPSAPGTVEMRFGSGLVREGDRVMVVKNDYNTGVYNGDVGKVSRIDRKSKEVELKIFEGTGLPPKLVRYPFSKVSKMIRLSYAQTVHKSQGQEYDVIVIPVLNSFGRQLQRNLFYTAITRAKQKVFLVGQHSAVGRAVMNDKAQKRNSLLSERIVSLSGR